MQSVGWHSDAPPVDMYPVISNARGAAADDGEDFSLGASVRYCFSFFSRDPAAAYRSILKALLGNGLGHEVTIPLQCERSILMA